jgi:hypothetical protein
MTEFTVAEYATYEAFAREWHAETLEEHGVSLAEARERGLITEDETRMRWQLLGQLDDDELLIELPEWLADDKVGFTDGATPTEFVGRIERETDQAIHFADAAAARPLMKLAHRIHQLEQETGNEESDNWMASRRDDHLDTFERREDAVTLSEEWLPKSQVLRAVRQRR